MLICDRFPTLEKAEAFKKEVEERFKVKAFVCQTEREAREYDVFPFGVDPIIVMVERPIGKADTRQEWDLAIATENLITRQLVPQYGGSFAGT